MFTVRNIAACALLVSFVFSPLNLFAEKEEKEWFPFYIPWNYCEGSKLDMSFLLDAPAGKYGFLTARDGHFYFSNGKRMKFWGLNIHSSRACFPTRSQAEDIAKRLAQLGCNIVRLHFLDNPSPDGIVDSSYDDSQHISESQMDRLDYFIYQLKQNGVYVCFDVLGLGARRFKSGDNVPEFDRIIRGASGISFFNERIIELSKKFAIDFLSHVNPYTGKSYLDEPAVAMMEMTNENTIFLRQAQKHFPPYYEKEIDGFWKKWLGEKAREGMYKRGRWPEDKEFLFELEDKYQREIYKYLRSIGVKVPIGASNLPYDNLTLAADSNMDFTDMHVYWDLCDKMDKIHNRPLIAQSYKNPSTIINTIAIAKVRNKPLISTEWGSNWPNDWRSADILTTVSYAALNDWDGLFLYAYNGGWDLTWDGLKKRLYYGTVIFNDPAKMGLFQTASLIFLRGDVRKSKNVRTVSYNINKLFKEDPYQDRVRLGGIPYVSRLEKEFYKDTNKSEGELSYPAMEFIENNGLLSDTKELMSDYKKGIFVLKTPCAFFFSGFVGKEKKCEHSGIKFNTDSEFATLALISLDRRDLVLSSRMLLTAVGLSRNKGQKTAPHITKKSDDLTRDVYVLDSGSAPILVDPVEAEITVQKRKNDKDIRVFSLDEKGFRKSEIPVIINDTNVSFKISGEYATIYFEIVRR
ncbi:MAG: hypothetical protein Q8N76_04390 [Candidatus Omnitrophota bacterium]|nr:hypothetical protein [Candidatus Omnitrophota bacterium]